MARPLIPAFLFFLLLMPSVYVFADAGNPQSARDRAMELALKEQAVTAALGEAETKEQGEGFAFILSRLHPYAKIKTVYNDNIYLTPDTVKGDWVNTLTPGIKFLLGQEGLDIEGQRLKLDLGGVLTSYYAHSQANRQKPYANFLLELGKGSHKLMLTERFRRDVTTTSTLTPSGPGGIVDYTNNNTDFSWEATYHRLGYELGYTRDASLYAKDFKASNSYEDQMARLTGFFQPLPKTRFLMEYNYGKFDYNKSASHSDNSDYHKIWLGVKGEITKKISGLTKFGYEFRDYKGGTDYSGATVNLDLTYGYSPATSFLLHFLYGNKPGNYRSDGYVKGTDFSLSLLHLLSHRIKFQLNLDYADDKYHSGTDDKIYICAPRLEYLFRKWLSVYLEYKFEKRQSNRPTDKYENNVCALGTNVEF